MTEAPRQRLGTRLFAYASAVVATFWTFVAPAQTESEHTPPPVPPAIASPRDISRLAPPQTPSTAGDDMDFAVLLRKYHEQSVDRSYIEIGNGKSPRLRDMAHRIVVVEEMELVELDHWIAREKQRRDAQAGQLPLK